MQAVHKSKPDCFVLKPVSWRVIHSLYCHENDTVLKCIYENALRSFNFLYKLNYLSLFLNKFLAKYTPGPWIQVKGSTDYSFQGGFLNALKILKKN